ncbi:MAG: 50S ribosomal protein L37e [Candidatus Woesearchaeota archaeon]
MKGTPSMGRKNKGRTHTRCRRCGKISYNRYKKYCSSCGFGRSKRIRNPKWIAKKLN